MTIIRCAAALAALAAVASLGGCAYQGPAGNGRNVSAIMASQMLPPQPHRDAGTDAGAGIAALANYRQSYVAPTPQSDSSMVGGRK